MSAIKKFLTADIFYADHAGSILMATLRHP